MVLPLAQIEGKASRQNKLADRSGVPVGKSRKTETNFGNLFWRGA
jgi:hypothetical protein